MSDENMTEADALRIFSRQITIPCPACEESVGRLCTPNDGVWIHLERFMAFEAMQYDSMKTLIESRKRVASAKQELTNAVPAAWAAGHSLTAIALGSGMSRTTINSILKEHEREL